MVCLKHSFEALGRARMGAPGPGDDNKLVFTILFAILVTLFVYLALGGLAFAGVTHLPGEDASDKLQAAGTLLKIIDTGLFKWGARIFAGVCIMSSAWALKEQRFGIAIICVIGAIIFGTAPTWVKNIFEIGGSDVVFSELHTPLRNKTVECAGLKSGGSRHV